MLDDIKNLLVLQDRDQAIVQLEKELQRLPLEEESAKMKLAVEERRLAQAEERIRDNMKETHKLELDAQTRRDSIMKLKMQQFETRKNEEFQAMGKDIQRYEAEIAGLEDQELALMEAADKLRARKEEVVEGLAAVKKSVEEELAALGERKANDEERLAELKSDRGEIAAKLDSVLLARYERVFTKKGGRAVVPLTNGICGGCHMKITHSTLVEVRAERAVTFCEQCGRILYDGD